MLFFCITKNAGLIIKKTGMNKELPSAYKEGNIVVVDTSLKVSVNGSIKV